MVVGGGSFLPVLDRRRVEVEAVVDVDLRSGRNPTDDSHHLVIIIITITIINIIIIIISTWWFW